MNDSQPRDGTRVARIVHEVRHRIDRRQLTPGARLPSIRLMAETMKVSKSTVVEAYDRLAAEGVIRARAGAGFFVTAPLAPLSLDMEPAPRDRDIDPLMVLRQSLEDASRRIAPGCGWLPEAWMPEDAMRRALRTIARTGDGLFEYDAPLGLPALRRLLARRMADHDIMAAPAQILLTDSGTHALDLVCRYFLRPGDAVMVDDPCYFNFHAMLRAHQVRVVGVPYTPDGPDLDRFAALATEARPRLYVTNSALHNPTGATLSPVTAHRVLKLAEAHDLIIAEDDIFADLEDTPAPRLATFDGLDRVIRIGSFSKTISASLRCGYIAARPDWIDGLINLRVATGISGGRVAAELTHMVLTDSGYRRHLTALRPRLARAMTTTIRRLKAIGITPWLEPTAGMFLWARLPDGCDATDLARRALTHNIVLAPGNAFSANGAAGGFMRFNVSRMEGAEIYESLSDLMHQTVSERAS
ncbi:PLP-dependent aminotransferase family protein [Gluconacetobacter azotocaptans]|uniref:PLP-dependent aminotransferase family protein n=1 Tax=Gluconacetobacter azotocaptans TaxID=142834 RepID=A0A7W4JQX7_9PROT|nr:PLP-dependent aminotransferase family protein [Gluconacetobacter azotocaptans]MBB2189251.1 PLP-dependent aminotransferase family protein [Gluconacetobacter azotocaptans]GBQ32392.1 transcriptional regulator [Gluconacetobacter azotocaptans DSM 13594]